MTEEASPPSGAHPRVATVSVHICEHPNHVAATAIEDLAEVRYCLACDSSWSELGTRVHPLAEPSHRDGWRWRVLYRGHMVMRQWSEDPSVTRLRQVRRELELDVMPGYRQFAEMEAARLGVPSDMAKQPHVRPSTNPAFPPGTATFRWEWWAVEVDDG